MNNKSTESAAICSLDFPCDKRTEEQEEEKVHEMMWDMVKYNDDYPEEIEEIF